VIGEGYSLGWSSDCGFSGSTSRFAERFDSQIPQKCRAGPHSEQAHDLFAFLFASDKCRFKRAGMLGVVKWKRDRGSRNLLRGLNQGFVNLDSHRQM
jgi:hypothetical protein